MINMTPPYTPELLPKVQLLITKYLNPNSVVLEVGSGYSTPWLAGLCGELTSLEHDEAWYAAVTLALKDCNLGGDLVLTPAYRFIRYIDELEDNSHNLVYIDCLDNYRIQCLTHAIPKLKKGGWMVLDDSHWEILWPAKSLLANWDSVCMSGDHERHTGETCFHQTTIFYKP